MSSFFKVVQTKERGKINLVAVPSAWEHNQKLRWPKGKIKASLFNQMVCDASSRPIEDWAFVECRVKRNNIPNYSGADEEIRKMLAESDSRSCAESVDPPDRKRKQETRATIGRLPQTSFTHLVYIYIYIIFTYVH